MTRTAVTPDQFAAFSVPSFTEEDNTQEDLMALQVIEEAGRKFGIRQHNPFSLWSIVSLDKKPLPEGLEGQYTSPLIAERNIKVAIDNEVKAKKLLAEKQDELAALKAEYAAASEYKVESAEVVERKIKTKPATKVS